ncbi:MAG: efflux RND transporter permease subunit, partial [Marinilabiliaceae bacterium]
FSLMYLTGVEVNIMSLGAFDFGIIIAGTGIVVEYISYKIRVRREGLLRLEADKRLHARDALTIDGASKMMKPAVFGQMIMIVVLVTVLSLGGLEGKMFRPMALTFGFAILGAMVFGFTFVPAISSLFIKAPAKNRRTLSDRLMGFLNRLYEPTIDWALYHKRTVIIATAVLLGGTAFLFTRMGSEFMPTMDEGDFVVRPVLKSDTSLEETIDIMTRMEKITGSFPETRQIVTRIGGAEGPEDPMSMEGTDAIITLKDKDEWETARSKEELADRYKERILENIPGIELELTQPIEMHFNKLTTGVSADLAIKLFGDDIEMLDSKGEDIRDVVNETPGVAGVVLEKTMGLYENRLRYNREKLASYGLNAADLNEVVQASLGGADAGTVYEGERNYDLVVRYQEDARESVEDLQNTDIAIPGGGRIPLKEVADVENVRGPARLFREDTRRHIVVGVHVRGRDLESVVEDVRTNIDEQIDIPPGYELEYGGQVENLRSARQRLMVVVPIALVLIFILLHFAFRDFRLALLVFSAVPLSAVGGVLLLWLLGIPFSISAGVGFVVLFGVSVLNGIVLMENYSDLKQSGMENLRERVLKGARQRLRPVFLTTTTTAFGFIPMVFSSGAGAEVLKPLATVVLGGVLTATLLMLVVLPVLYCLMEKASKYTHRMMPDWLPVLLLFLLPGSLNAQFQVSPENLWSGMFLDAVVRQDGEEMVALPGESRVDVEERSGVSLQTIQPKDAYAFDRMEVKKRQLFLGMG